MLSVIIIAKNEAHNLRRCLTSVSFADEIILLDTGSTDDSKEIAQSLKAKVLQTPWEGFGKSKQRALESASGDWVLSIDADEEVSSQLKSEILAAVVSAEYDAYRIPRLTQFLGSWIRHCGWYPDHVVRLFRRQKGHFTDAAVHEKILVDGSVGTLTSDLLHYSYPTLEVYLEKFNRYTSLGAEEALAKGSMGNVYDITVRPLAALIKHYFVKLGFLDGVAGILVSALSAAHVMVKYAKVRQLRSNGRERKEYDA